MVIVDITKLDGNIHSKFDRNSVNDAAAASTMRKRIEDDFSTYAKDSSLLANGAVENVSSLVTTPFFSIIPGKSCMLSCVGGLGNE